MSRAAEPGEVIQLDPAKCRWGPVFVTVTEIKTWGVMGYFHTTHADGKPGAAYIRVTHGDYERIGVAVWRVAEEERTT